MTKYYDDIKDLRDCWAQTKEWYLVRRYRWLLSVARTLELK